MAEPPRRTSPGRASRASAWSRAKQIKRALAAYDEIVRRYPNSRAAEQALHSKAHTFYSSGRWGEAVRAYSRYLSRYERGKRARKARFVRNFMDGAPSIKAAIRAYVEAVKEKQFPAPEHTF